METSKWFVMSYYLDYKLALGCPSYDEKDNRIFDLLSNIHNLIADNKKMTETATSYLFRPIMITAYM
jgi:hypothetical protein